MTSDHQSFLGVEIWLKIVSWVFEGTNTLIVLDDCAASKDVKGRTGQLVNLGFSARHIGISVWLLKEKLTGITASFRENVAAIVLFAPPQPKPRRPNSTITRGTLHGRIQKADFEAKKANVFLSCVLASTPIWRGVFILKQNGGGEAQWLKNSLRSQKQ